MNIRRQKPVEVKMKNRWLKGCIRELSDKWKDLWMTGQPKR